MGIILVVDDERSIRNTLRRFLMRDGHEVEVAANADEAVSLLKARDFDVVMTDIIMPRVTGVELLKTISKINSKAKVIMMTGDPNIETSTASLRFGAFDYLFKPISKEKILRTVSNALKIKKLEDDKFRLEQENRNYQKSLEVIVQERTQELRKSEKNLQMLLDSIPVGIVTISIDTHRIKYVNPEAEKILGLPQEKIIESKCHGFICASKEGECRITDHGETIHNEERIISTANQGKISVLATVIRIDFDENEYLLESFVDITQKKDLEKQLHQAQRMEALGNLAGGIAHDFNNILSPILGFTQLTLAYVEKGSDMEDDLKEIYTAGNRAKELVRQILTFARQGEQEFRSLKISLIAKEVFNFLRATIPTSIKLDLNIESESLILADPTSIYQIFMNTCTNAAHAMGNNGGELKVHLLNCELLKKMNSNGFTLSPGNYLKILISDTGIGIPDDQLSSIFEPYFTTKQKDEGTGLGLSVVHGIVKKHNGAIFVDSIVGKGTTFTLYLPVVKRTEEYKDNDKESLPTGSESILLVDDEPSIVKMQSRILGALGYTVLTCTSSAEALQHFSSTPDRFDLVVTDMTMPEMTGDKLTENLKKISPEIPVVLCTGFSKKIDSQNARDIGVNALIKKPVEKNKLATVVRKVLDGDKIKH
jgi:PAS domain S-box-containing protein